VFVCLVRRGTSSAQHAFRRPTARIRGRRTTGTPEGDVAEREDEREDDEPEAEADLDDVEPTEEDLEDAATTAEPAGAEVESIHDVLEKQEARDDEDDTDDDEPVATVTTARTADERLEPLEARVIPMQSTEFVCKNCYLVKHRSQLADKRRMLCRDCA
jgi:hypothetical protein